MHVSSFDLDLLEMGEQGPKGKLAVEQHLLGCARCREERDNLRRARLEFSSEVLPRTALPLRTRWRREKASWGARATAIAGLLASAAALVFFLQKPVNPSAGGYSDLPEHVKGPSGLSLVARREGRIFPVAPFTQELLPGDEIRMVLMTDDKSPPFVLVASIDGRGQASVYFPMGGNKSAPLERRGRWEIPGSVTLDDAPGPERIFAFLSQKPVDAAVATAALTKLGKAGWGAIRASSDAGLDNVVQSSVLIEKPSKP